MAILFTFDLDLEEDLSKVYEDAIDTMKYLADLTKSIEKRIFDGEKIKGLKVVDGRSMRFITEPGEKYLTKVLGEDKVYRIEKKFIGITQLESFLSKEDMKVLERNGYISSKSSQKVIVDRNE